MTSVAATDASKTPEVEEQKAVDSPVLTTDSGADFRYQVRKQSCDICGPHGLVQAMRPICDNFDLQTFSSFRPISRPTRTRMQIWRRAIVTEHYDALMAPLGAMIPLSSSQLATLQYQIAFAESVLPADAPSSMDVD
jgi:hypothetical protein